MTGRSAVPGRHRRQPRGAAPSGGPGRVSGPLVLAIESSCDETGIALVEGGRRIHANVVASQVALHAPTGGIVPEVAARAHLRWILPVLDDALADAGATRRRRRRHRGHPRPGPRRLAPRRASTRPRPWPGSMSKPLVGVNHLEGHVYAAWLLDPGEADGAGAGLPARRPRRLGRPHVPRRDARPPHATGSSARPSTTPRARPSTRSGGCSGSGYPGGPAIQLAAGGAVDHDAAFPRAWLGDTFDFSFSGLKTAARRVVEAERLEAGIGGEPEATLPAPRVAELAWGFQDSVTDVLVSKTIRAAAGVRRALDRPRRRRGRQRGPPRAARSGRRPRSACRWSSRGPACAPTTGR